MRIQVFKQALTVAFYDEHDMGSRNKSQRFCWERRPRAFCVPDFDSLNPADKALSSFLRRSCRFRPPPGLQVRFRIGLTRR
jgi:hypothetical protein